MTFNIEEHKAEILAQLWDMPNSCGERAIATPTAVAGQKVIDLNKLCKKELKKDILGSAEKVTLAKGNITVSENLKYDELRKAVQSLQVDTRAERVMKKILAVYFDKADLYALSNNEFDDHFSKNSWSALYLTTLLEAHHTEGESIPPLSLFEVTRDGFSPSPKISKSIASLGKAKGYPQETIARVQQFLSRVPKVNTAHSQAEIILSADPIDFITCSLNDYSWSSCTVPSGAFMSMPISLAIDSNTLIAYVSSLTSVYKPLDSDFVTANKQARKFIHFSDDRNVLAFSTTYPSHNIGLNQALIEYFEKLGYSPITSTSVQQEFFWRRFNTDSFVYDDVGCGDSPSLLIMTRTNLKDVDYEGDEEVFGSGDAIDLGATTVCVVCGNETDYYWTEEDILSYDEEYDEDRTLTAENTSMCIHCAKEVI